MKIKGTCKRDHREFLADQVILSGAPPEALSGLPPDPAEFVGREPELAVLHEAYRAAVEDNRCHIVTIFGPAGVGKSRLLKEFLERDA